MPRPIFVSVQHIAFLVLFYSVLSSARPPRQDPSYLKFVYNATDLPPEDYYDYIIVGGGTAGCPLAATLSQSYRVLLLERGGVGHGNPNLMSQDGFLTTLLEVDPFNSPAQAFISEDGVPNARGRILGGSSAINAGFYSRADQAFYSRSGFDWDLRIVNESYEWVEKQIVFKPELKLWQSAFRDGLLEAGIDPYNDFELGHVIGTKIGGSTFDSLGRRYSAADLLSSAKAGNITVAVYASVERVLLASNAAAPGYKQSAIGVVYRDERGGYHHAMVTNNGEVLLSAGAIGTPQLLLLSGIGPRTYLSSFGIPIAYHHPYVGQYMYDNPRNGISILPPIPLEHSLIQVVGITDSGAYVEAASQTIPFSPPPYSVFIRSPTSSLYHTVATLIEKTIGPVSSGTLRLASTDIRVNPIVRFNYFSSPVDVNRCINGTRLIGTILQSRAMDDFKFRDWFGIRNFQFIGPALPDDLSNHGEMADFCRRTVSTIWHYHGGCVVGRVVDRNHRVIGIDSLRIIDGSTFNISPGTNPQATLMMLGRYVGLKILKERERVRR